GEEGSDGGNADHRRERHEHRDRLRREHAPPLACREDSPDLASDTHRAALARCRPLTRVTITAGARARAMARNAFGHQLRYRRECGALESRVVSAATRLPQAAWLRASPAAWAARCLRSSGAWEEQASARSNLSKTDRRSSQAVTSVPEWRAWRRTSVSGSSTASISLWLARRN